jgi:hypothetical protein
VVDKLINRRPVDCERRPHLLSTVQQYYVLLCCMYRFHNLRLVLLSEVPQIKGPIFFRGMVERRRYVVNTGLRAEASALRAKFSAQQRARDQQLLEQELERQKEAELLELRKEADQKLAIELKTKRYFEFNKYNRKIAPVGSPYFVGDTANDHLAWTQDGQGKFLIDEEVVLDGTYQNGEFVKGKILFRADGSRWEGGIRDGVIHGAGTLTHTDGRVHSVLAHDGHILCNQDSTFILLLSVVFHCLVHLYNICQIPICWQVLELVVSSNSVKVFFMIMDGTAINHEPPFYIMFLTGHTLSDLKMKCGQEIER